MKNHIKIFVAAMAISCGLFVSCTKDNSGNEPTVAAGAYLTRIFLTDHQTPVFDSVFIDIQQLELKVQSDSAGEIWINMAIRPGIYNILRFRNGIDTIFSTGIIPTAQIKQLRLTLGNRNSVMKDNVVTALRLHDNDRQIMANISDANFEITATGEVIFWIDFDAAGSIQVDNSGSGNNNGYRLRSHISIFAKHKSGALEGKVLPRNADALVMAINGSDTAMAVPDDDDGEFKIIGLHAGTYRILYDGQNGFSDTLLNGITVVNNEDRHLPLITLHQ